MMALLHIIPAHLSADPLSPDRYGGPDIARKPYHQSPRFPSPQHHWPSIQDLVLEIAAELELVSNANLQVCRNVDSGALICFDLASISLQVAWGAWQGLGRFQIIFFRNIVLSIMSFFTSKS